jgi:hypothetical protein
LPILVDPSHDQILLQLDREQLEGRIVPSSACCDWQLGKINGGCVPHVEVWYPDDIPIRCVKNVYAILATDRLEFRPQLLGAWPP